MKILRFKKLSSRFLFYMVLLVTGASLLIALINFHLEKKNFDHLIGDFYLYRISGHFESELNGFLEQKIRAAEYVAQNPELITWIEKKGRPSFVLKKEIERIETHYNIKLSFFNSKGQKLSGPLYPAFTTLSNFQSEFNMLTDSNFRLDFIHSPSSREAYFTLLVPIKNKSRTVGTILVSIDSSLLVNKLSKDEKDMSVMLGLRHKAQVLVIDSENNVILDTDFKSHYQKISDIVPSFCLKRSDTHFNSLKVRDELGKLSYLGIFPIGVFNNCHRRLFLMTILNRKSILQVVRKNVVLSTLTGSLFILILLIGIAMILFRNFQSPLENLRLAAENISQNKYDMTLPSDRNDEIGEVARAFASMMLRLRDYHTKLEDMIDIRTHELQAALSELEKKDKNALQELRLAASIQNGIMPGQTRWNEISIFPYLRQKGLVGGDIFDFLSFENSFLGYLADISGHGIPASLLTILTKIIIMYASRSHDKIESIASELNAQINTMMSNEKINFFNYLTLFLFQIDNNYRLRYLSAGHIPAIVCHKNGGSMEYLDTTGSMIGLFSSDKVIFKPREVRLEKGDRMFLFSDGLISAHSSSGENFGISRLSSLIQDCEKLSIRDCSDSIIRALKNFIGDTEFEDDIALLVIERSEIIES